MNNILTVNIKYDSIFKSIYLREEGRIHMCSIISDLYELDYEDLIKNLKIYNSEHPRLNKRIKSSYSDVVYEYKNKLFIIEMNNNYYVKSIYKNHFYLLFRQVFNANNKNNYNMNKETYLIEIDNYDLRKNIGIESNERLVSYGKLKLDEDNLCIYKNINTARINLDYLKKIKYNYDKLKNIERNCLVFVEQDKEKLIKYGNYKNIEGVIRMLEVIEVDGKFYPVFDEEEWQESLRQEMKERGLKEGREEGRKVEKKAIALKLKKERFPLNKIIELTGLTKEDIMQL